jgi:Tetratricopeptide repeat
MSGVESSWKKLAATGCLLLCLGSSSFADTIVLKNGRRITAVNVKETDTQVVGETPAGTISLPSSMVERVEHGAATDDSAAADLRWSRPRSSAAGDEAAIPQAAAAESAAAAKEFSQGNLDEALVHAERAVSYDPTSVHLLLDVAYFHLRRAEYSAALDFLDRAGRLAPDSTTLAKLKGWADYGLNRLPQAIQDWKRSQQLQPDDDVAAALAKAERDLEAERSFRDDGSEHFALRYDGAAAPELARGVLRELESDFESISSMLDYNPPEPIGVLLYTNQGFSDVTRAPSWASAINDGRIRIPVQGLTSVTPELAKVLRHELTHSLVRGKTLNRCPVWLQEGAMDGRNPRGWPHGGQTARALRPPRRPLAGGAGKLLDDLAHRLCGQRLRMVACRGRGDRARRRRQRNRAAAR